MDNVPAGRFPAFAYRNYRLFFLGQLVSVTGTWMQSLAQSYLVYEVLGASPFDLGLVNVFQFAPVIVLGIPAGVLADRLPKRNLLVFTQSVFALLAAVLAFLVASGDVALWQVYTVALLFGVNNALDMPTRQSFVPELVGKPVVMNAIALNATMFNTGRVLGPAVAGIVLAAFGPATCFGINAASYLAVIIGLLMMNVAPMVKRASGSALERLREGLGYVRTSPPIYRTIILVGAVGIFGMNFNVWVPLLASDAFDSGAGTYGLLFSTMGVGSLIGALSLAAFGRSPSRQRMLGFAILLGIVEVALGIAAAEAAPILVGLVCLAITGYASSVAMATANTLVQTSASDELRGRVMAVYMTVFAGTAPFGALVSGSVANHFGIAASVGLGGAVTACASIAIAILQRRTPRPADERTATAPP